MITQILDTIMTQALSQGWVIKYVALEPAYMAFLVSEVKAFVASEFQIETLSSYKDIPLKVKDILGFQVAYESPEINSLCKAQSYIIPLTSNWKSQIDS